MLLGRQASNRTKRSSKGRGQDSMSRGAPNSSSKLAIDSHVPKGPIAMRDTTNTPQIWDHARGKHKKVYSKGTNAGSQPGSSTPNAFEKERLENAAKRAQREKGTMVNGRGGRGGNGVYTNKSTVFSKPATEQKSGPFSKQPSPTKTTPFAQAPEAAPELAAPVAFNPFAPRPSIPSSANKSTSNSNPFGAPPNSEAVVNPFGKPAATTFSAASTAEPPTSPFNNQTANSNPFGAPSKPEIAINPFGKPSSSAFGGASPVKTTFNPFDKPSPVSNPFGAPSRSADTASVVLGAAASIPWSKPSPGAFGAQSTLKSMGGAFTNGPSNTDSTAQSKPSPFGTPSSTNFAGFPLKATNTFGSLGASNTSPFESIKNEFGVSNGTSSSPGPFAKPSTNGPATKSSHVPTTQSGFVSHTSMFSKQSSCFGVPAAAKTANSLAAKVEQQLKKDRIIPPSMPTYDLMFERQLLSVPEISKHVKEYKAYQEKVRTSLMKAGLIDDPEKPKCLKDAIDFKGTCEDMCPQLEKIERLSEGRVDISEKGVQANGTPTRHAVMEKMVKILARSSAGQSAPLPSEVRTTGALRRTVDYLMKDVLTEANISKVHGFLWNRTRAIRRDFVFHSFMSPPELVDQVHCLETIARFHAISLHLMSKPENYSETFDTHQEFEQLGNTMISLMQAYGDCKANGVICQNEAEFRAYLIVIQRKMNPGLMEMVYSWGWDLFEAKEVKTALGMAEALGNTWDMHGPLKPAAATDIAQNAFSRFFDFVEDKNTSYTMACFAEIWFNDAREAIVRTILTSYRKQRNQIKDWTVPVLNEYLKFDDESDIIPWCEARDVVFEEADGLAYLSMEPGNVLNHMEKSKQYHSRHFVEKKRGLHSLQHVLYNTVYEEAGSESPPSEAEVAEAEAEEEEEEEEEEGLFVKQFDPVPKPSNSEKASTFGSSFGQGSQSPAFPTNTFPPVQDSQQKPTSLLDRIGTSKISEGFPDFSTPTNQSATQPTVAEPEPTSSFAPQPINGASSIFTKQPVAQESSIFTKQPVNGAISSFPSQPSSGPFSFFPKQQLDGRESGSVKPSTEPTSISTQPASLPKESPGSRASSTFSFAPRPFVPSPLGNEIFASPPSPAVPKSASFFPQQKFAGPQLAAAETNLPVPVPQSEPLTSQPLPGVLGTPIHLVPKQGFFSNEATPLQSNTPKGSPGSCAVQPSPTTHQAPNFDAKPPPPPFDRFAGFTDWYALGSEGILEQFTAFQVGNILQAAAKQFAGEESERLTREAEESARAKADLFRYRSLAKKYGYLWREQAHLRWLKRRGREARKARREMAESYRASKAAQSAAVVEDFRASTTKQRRGSLESLLGATGILDGVHNTADKVRAIVQEDHKSPHKRQRLQRSEWSTSRASATNKHKRGKSDNPFRRSLLSDPTYLHGGSRIHLMSDCNIRDEQHRPQVSGVQTDYFRLKARGISTLHDGTPLANSAAQNTLSTKRSFDGFTKPATPRQSREQSTARSVPTKATLQSEMDGPFGDQGEDVEALKARAKAVMSTAKNLGKRRSCDGDDEDLFARAKRIREQMEEGERFYRKELERDAGSRSAS